MTVKYINSKNEVLEFIGADILPTSGYLHQRKWNTNKENDITATDLCSLTKMQKSQMNRTLMNMEKKNWIIRQRSDKDKRQILIALNEEKMRAYQEQHEHILNIVNKLIELIGQENTEKTVELLNLIVQIAREEII